MLVKTALCVYLKGGWVKKAEMVKYLLPTVIIYTSAILLGGWTFIASCLILEVLLTGWFVMDSCMGTYCFKKLIQL